MNLAIVGRLIGYTTRGDYVTVEFASQNGHQVRVLLEPSKAPLERRDIHVSAGHFFDILAAVTLEGHHIDGLPGYCQCESCRSAAGAALAYRIEAAKKRQRLLVVGEDPPDAQHDPVLFPWLMGCQNQAGDFLKSIAEAALRADAENYALLRGALLTLRESYPEFTKIGRGLPGVTP